MPDDVDTIEDLVKYSLEKDYNKANEVFGNVMTVKMNDVLDQAKTKLAGQIYNDEDPDPEEPLEDEDFEENEDENEYKQYAYLHKHEEGSVINTNDSKNSCRMSIRNMIRQTRNMKGLQDLDLI